MNTGTITSIGIDVAKHKSTVAVRRPGGEVALLPFRVKHDIEGFSKFVDTLRSLNGEIGAVLEQTGMCWRPITLAAKAASFLSVWSMQS